jgi:hypothetical protein
LFGPLAITAEHPVVFCRVAMGWANRPDVGIGSYVRHLAAVQATNCGDAARGND